MEDSVREEMMKRLLMCCIALSTMGVQSALAQTITAKDIKQWEGECARGIASGCSSLGYMYYIGEGVKQDKFKAVELYTKACDGGDALGCTSLGIFYERGEGVKLDKKRALALFGKACDLKNEHGCKYYATLKGQGH